MSLFYLNHIEITKKSYPPEFTLLNYSLFKKTLFHQPLPLPDDLQ